MKPDLNLSRILPLIWCVAVAPSAWAIEGCKVRDPELRQFYSGGCNRDGWAEGTGVAKGTAEYAGDFHDGYKHGRGVKTWPWGDRYVGDFVQDYLQGRGVYVWGAQSANAGDSYIGEYRADKRHGRGIYRWASGEQYDGTWENNTMTGAPTGMAVQRRRAYEALKASVVKPGAVVCRNYVIGIGSTQRVRSSVIEADVARLRIAVRADADLPVPVGGMNVRAGEIFWDEAIHWEPCQ